MVFTIGSSQKKSQELLFELYSILDEAEEKKWIGWIREQQQKFDVAFKSDNKKNQVFAIKEIMELLKGGMGRFSDVYLCEENGHKVKNEIKINKRLDLARHKLYMELEQLKFVLENYSEGQN